ncbi:MAG: LysM peptidoglycan-binding domain-containing protein [Lachnospiraceae bacterium]|nr:LysM peptidoglycan-binding domain-containing protein [Lachnospiraceae bacterium]
MSRMNQVILMGEIREDIHIYIEDYAYTYLKKQKENLKAKYFLYGEREQGEHNEKIYIYGVSEKPKLEQTYFKEYYPVGFLKIKEEKAFWISLKGEEVEITGCYIFYAPNQAMQEYLVDHQVGETEEKKDDLKKREVKEKYFVRQEDYIPIRTKKVKTSDFQNEKFMLPISGIVIAVLILVVISTPNGRKKVEILKEVMAQTISQVDIKEELVIEEININNEKEEKDSRIEEQDSISQEEKIKEVMQEEGDPKEEEVISEELEISKDEEDGLEEKMQEYIIQEGDTLVGICKNRYGTTAKMKEVCEINGIEDADYIAPGQKIYLP